MARNETRTSRCSITCLFDRNLKIKLAELIVAAKIRTKSDRVVFQYFSVLQCSLFFCCFF